MTISVGGQDLEDDAVSSGNGVDPYCFAPPNIAPMNTHRSLPVLLEKVEHTRTSSQWVTTQQPISSSCFTGWSCRRFV